MKETKKPPQRTVVDVGTLLASGVSVKIAEHDGKKCASCSEFRLQFITHEHDSFVFKMQGQEFNSFYKAIGTALEKLAETIGEGEEEPHA